MRIITIAHDMMGRMEKELKMNGSKEEKMSIIIKRYICVIIYTLKVYSFFNLIFYCI